MTIKKIAKTDRSKEYIATNKKGDLQAFHIPDLQYTRLGKFIIFRLKQDRDVKMVITGSGKSTGTGKTTLAIHLARFVNKVRNYLYNTDTNWQSKEYSFMNAWEYLNKYRDAKPGDALITDELEYMADRRRAMSNKNMYFSQSWSVLRWKGVVTIGTAPGLSDLEKRIPEGADIWLNVIHKGRANTYYLTVHDFEWYPMYNRLRIGNYDESILWNPIESDKDYQWLKEKKEEIGVPGLDSDPSKPDNEVYDKSDLNELERNIRDQHTKEVLILFDEYNLIGEIPQQELAETIGVSQSKVSNMKRKLEKEGIING